MEKRHEKGWFLKNLANAVTTLGLLITVWLLLIAINNPEELWLMLILAGTIGLSDLFDGWLARHLNIETNFGKAFDRLRDKFFICSFLIILNYNYLSLTKRSIIFNTFTEALVILVAFIEILLFAALIFGSIKKLDVGSSKHGKRKMFCQFVAISIWLISLIVGKYFNLAVIEFSIYLIDLILVVAIYLAIKSLENYYQKYTS